VGVGGIIDILATKLRCFIWWARSNLSAIWSFLHVFCSTRRSLGGFPTIRRRWI